MICILDCKSSYYPLFCKKNCVWWYCVDTGTTNIMGLVSLVIPTSSKEYLLLFLQLLSIVHQTHMHQLCYNLAPSVGAAE